jgi:disulfide bond formation protein DsbB
MVAASDPRDLQIALQVSALQTLISPREPVGTLYVLILTMIQWLLGAMAAHWFSDACMLQKTARGCRFESGRSRYLLGRSGFSNFCNWTFLSLDILHSANEV